MISFLVRYKHNTDDRWIIVRAPSKTKAGQYALGMLRIPQTDLISIIPLPLDTEDNYE